MALRRHLRSRRVRNARTSKRRSCWTYSTLLSRRLDAAFKSIPASAAGRRRPQLRHPQWHFQRWPSSRCPHVAHQPRSTTRRHPRPIGWPPCWPMSPPSTRSWVRRRSRSCTPMRNWMTGRPVIPTLALSAWRSTATRWKPCTAEARTTTCAAPCSPTPIQNILATSMKLSSRSRTSRRHRISWQQR